MNQNQRLIILIGIFLVLLSGLFPAYEGEWRRTGDNYKKYLGYHFIFNPPDSDFVGEAFRGKSDIGYDERYSSQIIASRFFIQIFTILIVTLGLVILFKDQKPYRPHSGTIKENK